MPGSRKKVLFVDDDVDLLELLKQLMTRYSADSWEVLTAIDVSKALVILQQRKIDLLVVDVRMPLVDGVQFLGLLQRKYPQLIKVVLTAEATEEHRSACLGCGAELFLEKPRDEGGWRAVHAMLNELAKFQPDQGFTGVLRRVGLQDVLQMECLARSSVVLAVRAGEEQGAVFVQDGQIVHAELGGRQGEDAFNQLMGLAGGEFELRPWTEPAQRSVTGSWEFLLMEAARARDEKAVEAKTGDTGSPFLKQNKSNGESTTVVPVLGGDAEEESGGEAANQLGPATPGADTRRPQVDELLICSLQGEVLHEWHCANTTGRVAFLEFVSQKARQLAHSLPLGAFDRLEVNADDARAIAQIQPDRAFFLRTSRVPLDPTRPPVREPLQP
jgi:CheY-like chemotaxis protein